jgi:hypothetical protein
MNNKGGSRYMSPVLFLAFVIIAVGIVASVIIIYSSFGDVREKESNVLAHKIVDCLSDNGKLNEKFLDDDFDLFEVCALDRKILDNRGFYLGLDSNKELKNFPIKEGESDFEFQCRVEGEQFAKCVETKVYVFNDDEEFEIKVFAGSNNAGSKL